MQKRRYPKILFLAVLCMCLLQAVSWLPFGGHIPTASAHSFVVGSDPIDGSTISKAPSLVRIYFDAPLAAVSQASVLAFPPGAPANGLPVNAGRSVINATNSSELDTPLIPASALPQGSYEVRWTALSLTDGHTTSGLIGFNLGASSVGLAGVPTLGPSTSNYSPHLNLQGVLSVAWDWLVLLALLFWAGVLLTDYLIIPRTAPAAFLAQARKNSRSLQMLCLLALLVGEIINLILRATSFTQTLGQSGISLDAITQFTIHTNYGLLWLARVALLLVALLLHWMSAARQGSSQHLPITPAPGKSSTRLGQLRQQARTGATQDVPATPTALALTLAPSPGKVTGAVAAYGSSTRGATASQPKITINFQRDDATVHAHSTEQVVGWLVLVGLVLLSLVLSNEIIQLAPLQLSAGILSWLALAAQAAWFGSLAYLGLILLPQLPASDPDHHAETLVMLLKRAKPLLLSAIGVLLVSEVFLSEATIQAPAQLLNDPYGRALLVRASLLVLMLLFTGYTLFVLLPKLQRQTVLLPVVNSGMPARRTRQFALDKTERTVKRALNTLAGLAAATLICVALMNFFAPPVIFPNVDYQALANQPATTGNAPAPSSSTQQTGNLTAKLQVQPARVGVSNTITLTLSDAQGKPVSDATVKLSLNMEIMNMGTANATINGGSSTYVTTFAAGKTFSMAGAWVVQVEIDRPGQSPAHLTFQVMVAQ